MTRRLCLFFECMVHALFWASAFGAFVASAVGEDIQPIPSQPDPLFRFGTPEGTVINEGKFCLAFDGRTRQARWVLHRLTAEQLKGDAERADNFYADPRIPAEFRHVLADYSGSGYDRGHLAPAGDFGDACDKALTFGLANISPQVPALNRGSWRLLEEHVRSTVADGKSQTWVCTMPIFLRVRDRVSYQVLGTGTAVPTHFGKSVLHIDGENKLHLYAWLAPNAVPTTGHDGWRVATDDLERAAGLDLWAGLPDDLESKLEAAK